MTKQDSSIPIIAPFRGLRYNPGKISDLSRVTAPPYDVISPEGQRRLYERDPHNIVRLILGYQHPSDTDADNRYTRAAADLNQWTREEVLVRDDAPSFYLYEQHFEVEKIEGRRKYIRRGFLALRRLEKFEDESGRGSVRPHEKTLSGPKADRLLLFKSCHANLSPIFSLYSDREGSIAAILKPYFDTVPLADFTDEQSVRHRLWKVSDRELFRKANSIIGTKSLFIADGHHRYETAVNYCDWMRGRHPDAPPTAPFRYVMMFFSEMSDPGLLILPTHRVLHDWPGFDLSALEKRLEDWFEISRHPRTDEKGLVRILEEGGKQGRHLFGMGVPGRDNILLLTLRREKESRVSKVDTAILHNVIFREMLGMSEDDQKDPRYLRFVKDTREALTASGEAGVNCVFITNAPPMPVLEEVVAEGKVLPPKTTFFYPKLVSGLVLNQIRPDELVTI